MVRAATLRTKCLVSALSLLTLVLTKGCAREDGCLAGDNGVCIPVEPCAQLAYAQCADPHLEIGTLTTPRERPGGLDALAAGGDIFLANSQMRAVVDAIAAPHYLSPSGGELLDLVPMLDGEQVGEDELNAISHTVGILPADAVRYRTLELRDERPHSVSVIARGTLDGRPKVTVVTRYEVRPCEPGIRIRTELFHGGREPETFFLADALYWGSRESAPFAPVRGRGFEHPDLDLLTITKAFIDQPFVAAKPQRDDAASYALVACRDASLSGFHSATVSAVGLPRAIVMPGDSLAFERFLAVGTGPGAHRAIDSAMQAREALFGEASVRVNLTVRHPDGEPITPGERVGLLFFREVEGARIPLNEAVVGAAGQVQVRLPRDVAFSVEPHVLGKPRTAPTAFPAAATDVQLPDLVVPRIGHVNVTVRDTQGSPELADLVLTPTDDALAKGGRADLRGSLYGAFNVKECLPYLGPPHGGSPACNRVLTAADGTAGFDVPEGSYWMYSARGPFAPLRRERLDVRDGETLERALVLPAAGVLPVGVLSADFHVHGGASFDSSLPDLDRVKTFVAEGIDVLAATDHDVVTNYEAAIAALGMGDRVRVMPGAETTGHILFARPPGSSVPKVVGHYNFWPLRYDASLPRNGLPWEELLEPGALFDQISPAFQGRGVIQFNHPVAGASFGRDEGFLSAVGHDPRKPIPASDEATPNGQLRKRGPRSTALDYHVQEVMNGTSTLSFLRYRAAWFSFLNQGLVRAGTANSDSHTLAVEVLGFPRNLVFGDHTLKNFDIERFNDDVRKGHMVGTNGPILVAELDGHSPSVEALSTGSKSSLHITVDAMPWIPVEEVRIIVNGRLVRTLRDLKPAGDPFGDVPVRRYQGDMLVADLLAGLPPDRDAYIIIEAGLPLVQAADLDDDGYLDTTDNNEDGVINEADRVGRDEGDTFREPPRPKENDARYHAYIIAPGHWATAFTNPFLIDRGAPGFSGPGLP